MLVLTLDTSCVIHAAQRQDQAHLVDQLADLARRGEVGLSLTTAYLRDQERAGPAQQESNAAWLERVPSLGPVPGPFRLDYSMLGGPDVLTDDISDLDDAVRRIVLPRRLWAENVTSSGLSEKDMRRFHDVQHLIAHKMAGHDAFVTGDEDDMLDKRDRLQREAGIAVWSLAEAVDHARGGGMGREGDG